MALTGLTEETSFALVLKETPGKGGVWAVFFKFPDPDHEFLSRLTEFLEEGMRLVELT